MGTPFNRPCQGSTLTKSIFLTFAAGILIGYFLNNYKPLTSGEFMILWSTVQSMTPDSPLLSRAFIFKTNRHELRKKSKNELVSLAYNFSPGWWDHLIWGPVWRGSFMDVRLFPIQLSELKDFEQLKTVQMVFIQDTEILTKNWNVAMLIAERRKKYGCNP